MRVTIVGSGTLLPDDDHRSPGHLVEAEATSVLLDCGSGVLHGLARDGRDWRKISHVAITHFHTDHIGDLPALLWAWTYGVPTADQFPRTVIGPAGIGRILQALADAHGDFILAPGLPLEVIELGPEDIWEDRSRGLLIRTHETMHTREAVSYRVEIEGRAVGYTGDAGSQASLGAFLHGVELLISECSVPDQEAVEHHLSPSGVAQLASEAKPQILALTHLYPTVDRDALAELVRSSGFLGTVHVADDGLSIEL